METEIIEARTKNSRKILKSPHKYRLETSMGAIHYDPADWKPIENEIVNGVMDHADYQMNLLQANFDGGKIIRFSSAGESIDLQPMELDWINDILITFGLADNMKTNTSTSGNLPIVTWEEED